MMKLRKEKAERARKEAAEADEAEGTKKTISFGTSDGNSKAAAPPKPALRKGSKEKIKTFKHEMGVDVKIKISYTRPKNEVRKQVYNCLGGTLDFIRETLLLDIGYLCIQPRAWIRVPRTTTVPILGPLWVCALAGQYGMHMGRQACRAGNNLAIGSLRIPGVPANILCTRIWGIGG